MRFDRQRNGKIEIKKKTRQKSFEKVKLSFDSNMSMIKFDSFVFLAQHLLVSIKRFKSLAVS